MFRAALKTANREARIIAIGFASGEVPQIPANIILVKNISVIGFYWGGYLKFNVAAVKDSMADLMAMYVAGRLKPDVRHIFPFAQSQDALDLLEQRKSTGKVVVKI